MMKLYLRSAHFWLSPYRLKLKAYLALVLALALCPSLLRAQKSDSLRTLWQNSSQADSLRLAAFKEYIWNDFLFSQPDSAFILAEEMLAFGKRENYPKAVAQAYTLQGIALEMRGDFSLSMDYLLRAVDKHTEIANPAGISEAEIAIGVLFEQQGDIPLALEHYNKALRIDETIGNKEGMAMTLNNIGNIYNDQGNDSQALENYLQALAIDEELGIKQGISVELSNVAHIYLTQGKSELALSYFERALSLAEEIGDQYGVGTSLNSIGALYEIIGDYVLALDYYQKALAAFEAVNTPQEIAASLTHIGDLHLSQGEVLLSLDYCQRAFNLANEIGALNRSYSACQCLYQAHKSLGNNGMALGYHEEMISLRDSIYNEENTKKITRLQMQYDFDKKEAAQIAEQERKDAIAQQELQRQKILRNGFIGGFAIVLLFAGVFFKQRNRIGKEKNRSEELLLNILPAEVAEELKAKGSADAVQIDQVTVLFTDFKGFTAMSEKLSPKELVKDLHECFSLFDRICEKYGIEKIKTIGDAYMAAGGLPSPNSTHPQDVARAALEMAEVVEKGKAKKIQQGLPFFEIRIGIHTGPVVAGIVGVKKFQYDIWGDTVNTASRMESSGAVGQVNISEATYVLVKDNFHCTFRGEIEAKGKGKMGMWFVSVDSK